MSVHDKVYKVGNLVTQTFSGQPAWQTSKFLKLDPQSYNSSNGYLYELCHQLFRTIFLNILTLILGLKYNYQINEKNF